MGGGGGCLAPSEHRSFEKPRETLETDPSTYNRFYLNYSKSKIVSNLNINNVQAIPVCRSQPWLASPTAWTATLTATWFMRGQSSSTAHNLNMLEVYLLWQTYRVSVQSVKGSLPTNMSKHGVGRIWHVLHQPHSSLNPNRNAMCCQRNHLLYIC